jgi:hypothetical protein
VEEAMKVILEFNLPEDFTEHQDAIHGSGWRAVVVGFSELLRKELKYKEKSEEVYAALESLQRELLEHISDEELTL